MAVGIPDLRVRPDPHLPAAEDRRKGEWLASLAAETDFRGLLERYWTHTPDPPDMSERFLRHALEAEDRGHHLLETAAAVPGAAVGRTVLELGCRGGGVLVAAAARYSQVIGIDIAFRWLVMARKNLEEAGVEARLACCCAEALPLPDASVDLVLAENVLEHTSAPTGLLREAHRVLRPGGAFVAVTWNRLAPLPEPHVRLWGIGWLPRRAAERYVRWRKGTPYRHVRLLSRRELRRILEASPFRNYRVEPASLAPGRLAGAGPFAATLGRAYERARRMPLVRRALLAVAPELQAVCLRERA